MSYYSSEDVSVYISEYVSSSSTVCVYMQLFSAKFVPSVALTYITSPSDKLFTCCDFVHVPFTSKLFFWYSSV